MKTGIVAAVATGWLVGIVGCEDGPPTGTAPVDVPCPPNPIDVRSMDMSPTWSPDGRYIAYRHAEPGLIGVYIVDIIGGPPVKMMDGDLFGPVELAWSPDDTRIAMLFQGQIQTMDLGDNSLRKWTHDILFPRFPTWTLDGRSIFYSVFGKRAGEPDTAWGLRVIDTTDGTDHAFLHDGKVTFAGSAARVSPNGSTLVFNDTQTQGETYEIFSVRATGNGHRQLTHLGGSAHNPQWSADGQLIFFDYAPEKCPPGHSLNRKTWVMRPDGSDLRQWPVNLGNPRVQFGYPFQLSPKGEHVAFVGPDATGRFGVIHVMRLDGTDRRQLTFPTDSFLSTPGL